LFAQLVAYDAAHCASVPKVSVPVPSANCTGPPSAQLAARVQSRAPAVVQSLPEGALSHPRSRKAAKTKTVELTEREYTSTVERFFTCNLCEAQCGLRLNVEGDRVTSVRGDDEDLLSHGHVCPKAHALRELYEDPDRLRAPRIKTSSGWREASWDEALDLAASGIRDVQKKHGRSAVAFYYGNPSVHSHRGSLAVQLLTSALATKNRFDPNSQDSNPRLFACMQMYGDALSMPVPDVDRTDYMLMLGANPAASNGSMMGLGDPKGRFAAIRARGGKIVLLDPRRTESVAWATEHCFIRPDGDSAFMLALLHVIFESKLERLRMPVSGEETLRRLAADFAPERVARATMVEAPTIRRIARELATAERACVYSRVGVCQSAFGPVASWLTEALNVVTGNFDREGGVMFPTPAADIAPLGRMLIGNAYGRWRSRVRGLPEFLGSLPSAAMAEEMETAGKGQIRALVCAAGNPVLSVPNAPRLARAIEKLDFVVAIDFYLNETSRLANVVLPPKHVFETGNFDMVLSRFSVRNVVKYSAPIVENDSPDDWDIACALALRLRASAVRRVGAPLLRKLPEQSIDVLLRTGPYRTSLAKLRAAPHGIDFGPLAVSRGGRVRTPDRRIHLAPDALVVDVPRVSQWVDDVKEGGLVLIGRRHLRSNNSWMHNVRSLAKGPDRAQLMMSSTDATRLGLTNGTRVRIKSRAGEITTTLSITDDVMPGVVSLPHGFGHQIAKDTLRIAGALPGPNVNAITDEQRVEPLIGTSILNGIPITVEAE
jgi:anaerobic selenocysteine-containing dehydrogenase